MKKTKVAALLHDLGHGPFGHALDKYIGFVDPGDPKPSPDKYYTVSYIESFLGPTLEQKEVGLNGAEIAAILRRERRNRLPATDALIADIVDSPLDADRMDYLIRDAHMTGLSMGFTNTMALIDRMRPYFNGRQFLLTYDVSAVPYIEHFLYARDAMFINCYEKPRKLVAERIFTKVVSSVLEDASLQISKDDLIALTDEQIMFLLSKIGSGSPVRTKLAQGLILNLDYELVHEVPVSSSDASELLTRWNEDALQDSEGDPKQTYILTPSHWEELIAAKSVGKEQHWQVAVVVPSHELYQAQLSATNILIEDGKGGFRGEPFFKLSSVMKEVLHHLMVQRRKVRVFCSSDLSPQQRNAIKRAATEILGR